MNKIVTILVLLLVSSILLVGCGKKTEIQQTNEIAEKPEVVEDISTSKTTAEEPLSTAEVEEANTEMNQIDSEINEEDVAIDDLDALFEDY